MKLLPILLLLLLALSACACQRDARSGFILCAGVLP